MCQKFFLKVESYGITNHSNKNLRDKRTKSNVVPIAIGNDLAELYEVLTKNLNLAVKMKH